ncbi:MAG: protein kinase [Myxococcales bacterium]|nr:protein kinase [Myxococcales bacterium]
MASPTHALAGTCLGDEIMAGFLEATLSDAARDAATLHLSTCKSCREQFSELARLESDYTESYRSLVFDEQGQALHASGDDVDDLEVGSSLGRYVLLGKVGEGGMGVVYSAFDPELDRRIAVKVLRSEVAAASEEAKRQLRQEARAMARLTHPNVVRVYDVGRQGGMVYIAMEYVDGIDLGRFAARHGDDWRRVFD